MANPVLGRSSVFTQRAPQGYAPYTVPQQGYGQQGYPQGYGQAGHSQPAQQAPAQLMTFDDVIAKTGIALLAVLVVAFASYKLFGSMYNPAAMTGALVISSIAGFITVLVVSARQRVSAAGVLVYALFEGVFIGIFTAIFEAMYPGVAIQAVGATFAAAGCTLAAYHYGKIRVTPRFRRVVLLTTAAFAVVMLVNLVLALVGVDTSLRSVGGTHAGLGVLVAIIGAALAVFNLIVDFDYVQTGIRNGAPASESWRAALGITVTMVWLYTELLRILSALRR